MTDQTGDYFTMTGAHYEGGGDADAAETCTDPAQVSTPPLLTARTRIRVWRVTAGLAAALAVGVLIGRRSRQ